MRQLRGSDGRPSKYFYWEEAAGEEGAAPKNNSQAAEVAMNALVDLVIYIVLIGLVCGLLIWWVDQLGSRISARFHRVARIAIIVVAISLIISVLWWAASQMG